MVRARQQGWATWTCGRPTREGRAYVSAWDERGCRYKGHRQPRALHAELWVESVQQRAATFGLHPPTSLPSTSPPRSCLTSHRSPDVPAGQPCCLTTMMRARAQAVHSATTRTSLLAEPCALPHATLSSPQCQPAGACPCAPSPVPVLRPKLGAVLLHRAHRFLRRLKLNKGHACRPPICVHDEAAARGGT